MTYELKLPAKSSLLPEPVAATEEFYVRLILYLLTTWNGVSRAQGEMAVVACVFCPRSLTFLDLYPFVYDMGPGALRI
jgi:hypothetical protein